jgi:3-hydroxyacyl-CoA dehydrogenase/enoyl-CoA hydratase/3-hydroxybutyryl-CoA epimerase
MPDKKKWALEIDERGIAWLAFDAPGAKLNTLDRAALEQLQLIVDQLNIDLPRGLVLYSSKENGFVAGADINEFAQIESIEQAQEQVAYAHSIFDRIEAMPVPKVVLIHGFCLGGGLELALTFDYLLAEDNPACKLGLPEVKLGIHPGYGGSVRLIERIGAPKAMDLMLAGRVISARAAKKVGLVDQLLARRYFKTAARDFIQRAPQKKHGPKLQARILKLSWPRNLLANYLDKQVGRRVMQAHYPAPFTLIKLWRQFGANRDIMLDEEIKSVSALLTTDTAHNLVRVFFLQESLKSIHNKGKAKDIAHVHVIGAGVMGGDIAAWSALRGLCVTLQDQNPESIARAMARAKGLFKKKLKINRLVQAAMDRLIPDLNGEGIASADLIIEAIFENLEVKQQVFADAEVRAKASAILASNTSSIPIELIAKGLKNPARLVGIHFFNPVAKMQLVELVRGRRTTNKVLNAANAYILQINRMPVRVKSEPGFLVNRVLMPYLIEAVRMLDEGINAEQIDRAAIEFGMPVGPIELADVVGLDICLHVAENLLGEESIPGSLKRKVEAGNTGKKSGQGYYRWPGGKAQKSESKQAEVNTRDLERRMIYPLLNECVACLYEGVVATADEIDAGVIFGTGFAPFRGGPMNLIRHIGREKIIDRLEQLQATYGDRFKPGEGWEEIQLFK